MIAVPSFTRLGYEQQFLFRSGKSTPARPGIILDFRLPILDWKTKEEPAVSSSIDNPKSKIENPSPPAEDFLARGPLRDPRAAALFGANGREVALQAEALSRWPDGLPLSFD